MDGCCLLDIMQTRGSWKIDSTANMKILLNQSRGLISLNHQPSGLTMNGVCLDVWYHAELRVQCDFSFTWRWHGLDTRMILTHLVVGQTTASSLVNSMPSFEVSIPPNFCLVGMVSMAVNPSYFRIFQWKTKRSLDFQGMSFEPCLETWKIIAKLL
jgi:hypothetical protein